MAKIKRPNNEQAPVVQLNMNGKVKKHHSLRWMPQGEQEQKLLAEQLLEWCEQPDSFFVEDFACSKKINPYHFKKACTVNEYFDAAYQMASSICSRRLMKAGLSGGFDATFTEKILPLYSEEYRQHKFEAVKMAIEAKQKALEERSSGERIVVIERYPDSELVPTKESKNVD